MGKPFSIKARLLSFKYAISGIYKAVQTEHNLRIHLAFALLAILLGFILAISTQEWILIILCIGLVTAAEMLNSAIESVVNLASPEQHPLAGRAKDYAAGAVLILSVTALVLGIIIFAPKLYHFLIS